MCSFKFRFDSVRTGDGMKCVSVSRPAANGRSRLTSAKDSQTVRVLIASLLLALSANACVAESSHTITLNFDISEDVEGFPTLIGISDADVFSRAMLGC